jgi:hypothetical protein
MPVGETIAFAAGVVAGWTGRAALGSSREALVKALVAGHGVREQVKRLVAEQSEWIEDMFAEGRARYDEQQRDGMEMEIEPSVPPRVVELRPAAPPTRPKKTGSDP